MAAPMSLEDRIKLEVGDRSPAEVSDLILDDCTGSEISGLTDEFVNLASLSIINCGLKSLKGLPLLPGLVKLDASNNQISGDLDIVAKNCPNILHLNVSGNKIDDIEVLAPLKGTSLCELDIFSNGISSDTEHRPKLFKLIDQLQILDGCDVNGEEIEDDSFDEEESVGDFDSDDDVGLSYLDNSQLDEDETEDYDPEVKKTKKRAADDEEDVEEPPAKKEAN